MSDGDNGCQMWVEDCKDPKGREPCNFVEPAKNYRGVSPEIFVEK